MIANLIALLQIAPTGKSEIIDTAKGKYKLPLTFKEARKWQ